MESPEFAGLGLLIKLPLEKCPQFFHKVIDGICGQAHPRFQDYSSVWSLSEWLQVLQDTESFITATVGKDEPAEKSGIQLNGLNQEYQETILKCVRSRRPEIKAALVQKVCSMSSAYLQDFDWQLKLAMSSDKLSTLQMPLVNLDLDLVKDGRIDPVSIEMNKEELQNLISSLEAANKVVLQLK
ncbi:COMM domain-containing protein 8 [Hyperolius riggenbachi]|uniref:COMM domain-containing protein 8 n=1 Tax=Hyperolius riggenbachi TaxID=752182 RepID=UPI0035A2FD1B